MKSETRMLTRMLAAAGLALASSAAQATDAEARALLKAMSDHVGSLKTIEVDVDTMIEVVTPDLEKIGFASSARMRLARPNGLSFERTGGYADVQFLFDGTTLTVRDRAGKRYAQAPVKGSNDDLVKAIHDEMGMTVPGADVLLTDSYTVLIADVLEAKVIGEAVIAGQRCDHLAFRNFDTDWQLWIRQGAEKIPCKMVITSKMVGMAPQYTAQVRSWKSNPVFPAGTFAFRPVTGETRIPLDQMTGIDELPPPANPETRK
jgi:hypothetical protein